MFILNFGGLIMDLNNNIIKLIVKKGIFFDFCLVMIIFYIVWKFILWVIFYGLMSWIYVFYYWVKYV